MSEQSEVPSDDRGLKPDATTEAAHHDNKVAEALALMREKINQENFTSARIQFDPHVQRAENVMRVSEKRLVSAKELEQEIADLLRPMVDAADPRAGALVDEATNIVVAHDQDKIDIHQYDFELKIFLKKLKSL